MNGWTVLMSALLLNALRRLRVAQNQFVMVESTEVPESRHLLGKDTPIGSAIPRETPESMRMHVKEIPNRSDICLNEVGWFRFWPNPRLEFLSFAGEAPICLPP